MPYLRHSSPADNPAACSFRTLMICSSVNLLLRMSVSRRNGLYPNSGAFMGSRSQSTERLQRLQRRATRAYELAVGAETPLVRQEELGLSGPRRAQAVCLYSSSFH